MKTEFHIVTDYKPTYVVITIVGPTVTIDKQHSFS